MEKELYELTNPQKSIWLTEQYYKGTSINTICGYVSISEVVNFELLKKAINEVVRVNDSMRFKFKEENDSCVQYVQEYVPFDIDMIHLLSQNDIENETSKVANTPFNIDCSLFKFVLFDLPNGSGGFIISVHHLISDSWTLGLIVKEIMKTYSDLLTDTYENQTYPSYLNYIQSENDYKNSEKCQKDKAYWDEIFQTIPEIASITPVKNEQNKSISCKGNREKFVFSTKDLQDIKAYCDTHKISIYNFFMAVYSLYISRVCNLNDFVIGTPILNRTNFEQKHTTGMFISVAPLRINLNEADSFIDFSKKISIDTVSLFRHQKYSYQSILEDVRKKDSSIPNLYNIALSYQITKTVENFNQVHYSTDWMFNGNVSDELQIHLFDLNDEASMTIAYDYKSELFNPQEIRDLHARILTIIKQIISNEAIPLKDIEIVTPEEKHQILYDFNNTAVDYPRDKTIVDLFEEQVEKTPDNIAVIFEDKKLTYRELNEKANQLARYLLQKNVQIGDIVGIYLNKSLEVVVSMLAILKTGAAFLPIDIDYPEDRLNYIINHSAPKAILSSKKVKCNLNIPTIFVDLQEELYTKQNADNLNISITPEDLMYIMYTSGSTGNPKGVMVKHKNIIRLAAFPNFINFDKDEVMVQTGTIVFDACIFEIFGSLLHGFKLYILKKENILDIPYFTNFLEKEKVTILFLTTGLFNQLGLQNPGMFRHLKYLLTGGDVISKTSIQKIRNSCGDLKIINCYGPTENGSYSTCYSVIGDEEIIPIGKPITNSTAYVVSSFGNLCPIGVPGELWVGGEGVARGYLNNDDLTKEQFINNPFGEGLIYKTGDLVKWLPDGNIAFIGRIDNQVKIRGFRIELSEIDRKILLMNDIKQSLTLVQNINNTKTICSYIISDKQINIQNLRNSLGNYLPVYMIPTFIMQLEKFPLNINGKVDMKAFPIPNFSDIKKNIIPARNELDQVIIDVLSQVLNITNISIEDSFFDLGGDSLSAISFTNILTQKLNISVSVSDVFAHSVIKELSDYISTLSESSIKNVIKKADKRTYYPASNAQKRVYYASSVDNDSILYNIAGGIIVDKTLDINLLQKCFNTLIDRHEVLRTRFDIIDNDIVQIIDDKIDFTLSVESSTSDDLNAIYAKFIKPFDLTKAPLFRAKVVKLENNKMLLLLDMHHIISDGTSISILLQELCDLYNGNTLPEKQVDYKDFTLWEKEQFETEEFKNSRDFWVNQYQDEIPLLNMPTTYSRPSVQSFEGANCYTKLPKEIFEKVNEVSKKLGITPYMLMLSVYYILLSKYTSQDDIVVGTPIVGRELPELSNMLGMFVNTLALRNKVDHVSSFSTFATSIKEYCLSAFQNQGYPFDELVKELDIKRDTSRNPLVDVMFVYQNNGYPTIDFQDAHTKYFIPDANISKFDLTLEIIPIDDEYSLRFEYCTKLFDEDFIKKLSSHYINILNAILENSDIKIADIDMLSEEEKEQILYDFNNTAVDYPRDKTIVDLFEEQVEKTPDNIAVVFEDQKLTYRELNEKANQLARYLVNMNIPDSSTIGVLLKRSSDIYICMLGILKSNHNYILIDHKLPNDRIEYMLKNSNSTTILTTSSVNKEILIDNTILIDKINLNLDFSNLEKEITPISASCIIYTSGSTGTPKGVMLTHRGIVNMFISYKNILHTDKLHTFFSMSTVAFDMFAVETYISLLSGGTVVLTNEVEQESPQALQDLIIKNNIDFILTTPSKVELLMLGENNCLKNVKVIQLGGEVFTASLYEKLRKFTEADIYNGYGPTEITACCSSKKVTSNDISIGTPFCNTKIFICDKYLNLLPIGVIGELCIAGDGLALGYINNEELTTKSFVKTNFTDKLIYRTGDLAYWDNSGEIRYVGRNDNQVKLRGLRIELDEISSRIKEISGVKNSVALIKEVNGSKAICAYISTSNSSSLTQNDVKKYLKQYLPEYMVPTFIMFLDEMPLTPNGKIDTKKLPDIVLDKNMITCATTESEIKLENICKKYLSCDFIDINTSLFEIGGDSLFAIKLSADIYSNFNINISVKEIFEHPSIKELSDYISTLSETTDKNVIKKIEKKDYYPVSSAQRRIYYASSMDNDSVLYNIAGGIIVDKTLDINLLQNCFDTLIDRHEVLRTRFDIIDNDIVQIIEDKIDFTLSVESSTSDDLNAIYAKFIKPFDLTKAPLFRAKVVKLENNKMLLLLDMHHIISDGTSISILLQELCDLYNGNTLPEKQVDYKDFTLWEKEQFETEEFKNSRDFWVNQYQDEIPLLNMPTTYSRPSVQSFEGANCYTKLPKEIFEKVNEVSKKLGITPYMLMLSVYYILLSKYTSQDDIVVGTPIVGRELPELSNMLGMFVNTLALRTKIDHSKKFSDFANSIKEYSLSTFQNQGYPFDELVKELDIKRDTSRNPLVDVMFVYQNNGYPTINFKDVNTEYFVPDSSIAKFDLTLEIVPIDNELSLRFEYCTKLFDKDFISRLSSHYVNILNAILENSDIKIADIDMLSKEEKNQILYDFNNTAVDYPRNKTIVDLFEEQVEKTPDNIAIVFEDQKLTYRELNEKANQLANYLLIDNVLPNDIVCLLLDKSLESIIAIMAILKVGAAYLPIDVNYPSERIDYIIKNSGSTVLLTTKNNIHKSTGTIQTLCIDIDTTIYSEYSTKNVNCKNISPDSLAYIMYTSGSTGNPKGVMVSHRNIVRLIKNNKFIEFDKHERILQTGSIVFDACTFEIFGSLLNGFELYIIKKEELLDASLLQDYLIKNKITTLWLTAPLFNQLCEENPHMFSTVKKLLTGGDVLSPKHINMVRAANPNLTVINGYGPTENTTFSCCFTIDRKYTNSIPIGRPISNSTAYVVSSLGKLCPIGVPGELWVGGDGVGKGYLNNDSLTNEKFIKNPFGDGIIYKTGDLVKWLSNGTIDFIGRIDNQVKIRGFRVELGEINGKIASFPSMKECVTVVNNIRGEKSICSYIVSDKKIDIQELRQYLKRNLPVYMIPTYFMQLEKLPINTNGKVDRKLLPTNFKSINAKNKVKLPSNDNEQILLDIFKKLLCFENIGIDDDFFELGGDSLLAIKLQVEAVSHNLQINYADIFDHPTVEELAKCIGKAEETFTEDNFDYEKYNSILEKNVITPNMKIANTPIGNVLLTGFTGFLGAHVLDSFIKKETGTIYCLIRGKNNMSPEERLKNVLHFYFDTRYDKYIGNRIKLVEGDITLPDFGLNVIDYNMLGTDINTVIHCAALVKHYGSYKDFESINILGTKRVIDFSKAFGLKLLHISTISVSGNNLAEGANIDNYFEKDKTFYETNFYIGQNLSNFYVRSKFEAERLVLDAISDGLQACILRMGNLTSRFSEGKFQQNHFENAFVNKIRSFIEIGCVPDYLLHTYCEFTPIDFCGNAIIDIANHITPNYTVFHLLNQKHVYLDRLFKMLNEIGIDINLVSEEEFKQTIDTILKDEKRKDDLDGIINNLDNNKRFIYKSDVMINSDFTKEFLSKIGFEWPYIDTNYIRNYFKYLSDIGYFNLNIK